MTKLVSASIVAATLLAAGASAQAQQVVLKGAHFLPGTSNPQVNIIQP